MPSPSPSPLRGWDLRYPLIMVHQVFARIGASSLLRPDKLVLLGNSFHSCGTDSTQTDLHVYCIYTGVFIQVCVWSLVGGSAYESSQRSRLVDSVVLPMEFLSHSGRKIFPPTLPLEPLPIFGCGFLCFSQLLGRASQRTVMLSSKYNRVSLIMCLLMGFLSVWAGYWLVISSYSAPSLSLYFFF